MEPPPQKRNPEGTYFAPRWRTPARIGILGIPRAHTETMGADGIRFLRQIAETMGNPLFLSLEG